MLLSLIQMVSGTWCQGRPRTLHGSRLPASVRAASTARLRPSRFEWRFNLACEQLRRDRHRRRPQRPGRRGLPGEVRRPDRGPGGPPQDGRSRRHHGSVAGGARHQGHHAQLRDEPHAALDPTRPQPRAVRLQGPPAGHGLPAAARRLDPAVGRRAQGPRVDREVLQARRRPVAEVRGVDRPDRQHHGAAPDGDAAAPRLEEGRATSRTSPSSGGSSARRSTSRRSPTSRGSSR